MKQYTKRRVDPDFYIDQTEEYDKLSFDDKVDILIELFGDSKKEATDIVKIDAQMRGIEL